MAAAGAVAAPGLAAGLLAWAPWVPPPVLRPAGLAAGPATVSSIMIRWSRPRTGPLPDKYLIVVDGTVAGSAAGTATSWRQTGLTPAFTYYYRLIAVRGGRRSAPSAQLTVDAPTPPLSQARLKGAWSIFVNSVPVRHNEYGSMYWHFSPECAAGACDVLLRGVINGHSYGLKLTRTGTRYQGQGVLSSLQCGPAASRIADPLFIKVRLRVTTAAGKNHAWIVTGFTGAMVESYQYINAGSFSCSASSIRYEITSAAP